MTNATSTNGCPSNLAAQILTPAPFATNPQLVDEELVPENVVTTKATRQQAVDCLQSSTTDRRQAL